MNILHRNTLLILLLIFPKTKGVTKVCDDIFLSCHHSDQLVIASINATTSLAKTILEQCNFKQLCWVVNPRKECVQVDNGCRGKMPLVEIREASHLYQKGNISFLNLMSFGYHKGNYMKAQQLNCTLKFTADVHRQVKVIINEFAPYTSTKDFCFKVENTQQPPFCSGSKALNIVYGTFDGNTHWKFGMSLAAGVKNVPKVRFWLNIAVHPNSTYHLECDSDAVPNSSTHPHFVMHIVYVVGGIVGVLLLLAFGFIFWLMKRFYARLYNVALQTRQDTNYDIEAAALERYRTLPETNLTSRSLVTETLQARLTAVNVYNLSQISTLRNDSNLQNMRFIRNDTWNQEEEEEMCEDVDIIDNAVYDSYEIH